MTPYTAGFLACRKAAEKVCRNYARLVAPRKRDEELAEHVAGVCADAIAALPVPAEEPEEVVVERLRHAIYEVDDAVTWNEAGRFAIAALAAMRGGAG